MEDQTHPWLPFLNDLVLVDRLGLGQLCRLAPNDGVWVTFADASCSFTRLFDFEDDGDCFPIPWRTGKEQWTLEELAAANTLAGRVAAQTPTWETMDSESDRGQVMIAAQGISQRLGVLLRNRLVEPVPHGLADGDRGGDLSRRVKIAYACGLLPSDVYKTLRAIVSIRNSVAHDEAAFSLSRAQNQLGQVPAWRIAKTEGVSHDVFFHAVVAWLNGWLESAAERERLLAPDDVGDVAWTSLFETVRALPDVFQNKIEDLDRLIAALERE